MSGRAFGWAKRQDAPDRDSKALLVFLADYVQDTPFAWPAVATIAAELQVSERTVQRLLPVLLKAGLIIGYEVKDKATGRCRTRAYFFPIDSDRPDLAQVRAFELNAGCVLTQLDAEPAEQATSGEGDSIVTLGGDAAVTGEGDSIVTGRVTAVSPLKEPTSELSDADASSTGGRACAVDLFGEAWAAYPELGRLGASSERLGRKSWGDELVGGASPDRILAGIRAYAGNRAVWGASGRPKAFHRFLSDGCWVEFADAPVKAGCPVAGGWPGPANIRMAIAQGLGEGFAFATLDAAGWNGSAVVAKTRWAANELRTKAREILSEIGVEVLNPP